MKSAVRAACIFFFLFVPFSLSAFQSSSQTIKIPLKGKWLINTGDEDNSASPGLRDKSWDTIELPGSFIRYLKRKTGKIEGIIWIRKHITVPEKVPPGGLGLVLGRIGNADITMVNGHIIGETGGFPPKEFSMWNYKRFYHVPACLLKPGEENIIAVRVYCRIYGEIRGDLFLGDMSWWSSQRNWYLLSSVIVYYGILGIGAAIGLLFLVIFIMGRGGLESAFFIMQMIPGFFVVYEICGFFPLYPDTIIRIKVFGFMWTALVVVHLMFLHRLYGLKRKGIERALVAMLIFFTFMIVLATDVDRHRFIALIVIAVLTPLAFYNISIHVQALAKKNIYARYLFLPGLILSLGAAHDGFAYLQRLGGPDISFMGYGFEEVVFGYAATVMFIGGAMILLHRFLQSMRQVEELNETLEIRVYDRTRELEESLQHLSRIIEDSYLEERTKPGGKPPELSSSTVQKIQNAVVYIHDNYMHDISREGLAAHLEINADHFGKAFRHYTGKKMNEYINALRIKRAAVMLKESNEAVIHIAFAVGFESLRTFNRAFLKVMGITPSEYRNDV